MQQPLALFVQSSPFCASRQRLAVCFLHTWLSLGKPVSRVFFYQDAVLTAGLKLPQKANGLSLADEFVKLSEQHQFPLQVCVASATRRGLINANDILELSAGFCVVGLGELAQAGFEHEKIVSF